MHGGILSDKPADVRRKWPAATYWENQIGIYAISSIGQETRRVVKCRGLFQMEILKSHENGCK
jgi:hypothetical protein